MISSGQRKKDAGHFDTLLYHEADGLSGLREQSCSPYVAPCPDGFAPKDVVDGINPGAGRAADVLREGGRVCLIHAQRRSTVNKTSGMAFPWKLSKTYLLVPYPSMNIRPVS